MRALVRNGKKRTFITNHYIRSFWNGGKNTNRTIRKGDNKTMRKSIKTIGTIGAMTILLCGAYYLGTTQAKTITVEKEVEKRVDVVPDGYVDTATDDFYNNYVDIRQITDFEATENGLQLYLSDGNGYYWER